MADHMLIYVCVSYIEFLYVISFNDWVENVVQLRGKDQFLLVQTYVRVI